MTAGRDPDQFTTTGWPWRAGNEFRLLDDGGDFFARMLQAIDAASRYVLLEMYLVRSGAVATRFSEAFARAARRGVRVCLVLDAFGALGFTRADRRGCWMRAWSCACSTRCACETGSRTCCATIASSCSSTAAWRSWAAQVSRTTSHPAPRAERGASGWSSSRVR